jgi:hypothetical protein
MVFRPSWRITRSNVDQLIIDVGNAIQDMDPATIVYQFLDSSSYYGCSHDGSKMAPRRDKDDGKFHLVGDITVSSKETQLEQFNDIKPLLKLAAKQRCIVITSRMKSVKVMDPCIDLRVLDESEIWDSDLGVAAMTRPSERNGGIASEAEATESGALEAADLAAAAAAEPEAEDTWGATQPARRSNNVPLRHEFPNYLWKQVFKKKN